MDIVGPLSESMTYLFTIVDRYTRWVEAIPMAGCSTETCIKGFLRYWIARFGIPSDLTSDRGPQFTSELWTKLNRLLGISASNTTAYHPQANGLVERMHRQLKASLKARLTGPKWMDQLPMVLLGIRTAWREDAECSPADLVYGTALHLPGEFSTPQGHPTCTRVSSVNFKIQCTLLYLLPPSHTVPWHSTNTHSQ